MERNEPPDMAKLKRRLRAAYNARPDLTMEKLAELLRPRLKPLGEKTGYSYGSVQAFLDDKGKGKHRRVRREWVEAFADVVGFRAEYLWTGEGPTTVAEEEEQRRGEQERYRDAILNAQNAASKRGEALRHSLLQAPDVALLLYLDPDPDFRARRRRGALLRFARKLDDVADPGAPWRSEESRRDLLTAAHAFLAGAEAAFEHAGGWSTGASTAVERIAGLDGLLARSLSDGEYVSWSDAGLDFFSRRVYGLGTRPVEPRAYAAPEAAPTPEGSP